MPYTLRSILPLESGDLRTVSVGPMVRWNPPEDNIVIEDIQGVMAGSLRDDR